jgi:hypothetical protein
LAARDLPIEPYVLGAWLGDGNTRDARICCHEPDLLVAIAGAGCTAYQQPSDPFMYRLGATQAKLRALGLLGRKHIPPIYLRASIWQRMALLKGLMDTDGHCPKDGVCEFTTVLTVLADGFQELVHSLGIRTSRFEGRATLCGRDIGPKYRIQFSPPMPVFTLTRKLARQRVSKQHRRRTSYRTIIAVEPIASMPVRCIQVDSPSNLYLAGRGMIPTHNTTLANQIACQMALPMRGSDEAALARGILPVVDYRLGEEMREDWGHGWTVALASFEQRPPDRDLKKALRRYRARRHPSMVPDAAMKLIDEWIDAHFALIVPSEDVEVSVEWMLEHLAAVFTQDSARLAIVDPWNEMDHIRPRDLTLTEYTGFAIKAFKRLAAKYQAHIMMVAHPTKMKANAQGELPCPTLYDISDSAHFANKSDAGLVVHRETNDRTMIKIAKTRYEEIGRPGKLYGTLLRGQGRFEIEVPESERGDVE